MILYQTIIEVGGTTITIVQAKVQIEKSASKMKESRQ
jgi:hypothetical protein